MSRSIEVELEVPDDLARFHLPPGVNARLTELLDRQDRGISLTDAERLEAEGLVDLPELGLLHSLHNHGLAERKVPRLW